VGIKALADVLKLGSEGHDVLGDARWRVEANGFAAAAQLKTGMPIAVGAAGILFRLIVRPDEHETLRWYDCAKRDLPFRGLTHVIREIEAGEIEGVGIRVEEFEPILEETVHRIGVAERRGIVGHPLI